MNRKQKIGIGVLLLGVCAGLFATALFARVTTPPSAGDADARRSVYTITSAFGSERLNSRLWVSHACRLDPNQSPAQTLAHIRRQFRLNTSATAVLHGNAAHMPVGWAFLELRNATATTHRLVLSMPQYRFVAYACPRFGEHSTLLSLDVAVDPHKSGQVRTTPRAGSSSVDSLAAKKSIDVKPLPKQRFILF